MYRSREPRRARPQCAPARWRRKEALESWIPTRTRVSRRQARSLRDRRPDLPSESEADLMRGKLLGPSAAQRRAPRSAPPPAPRDPCDSRARSLREDGLPRQCARRNIAASRSNLSVDAKLPRKSRLEENKAAGRDSGRAEGSGDNVSENSGPLGRHMHPQGRRDEAPRSRGPEVRGHRPRQVRRCTVRDGHERSDAHDASDSVQARRSGTPRYASHRWRGRGTGERCVRLGGRPDFATGLRVGNDDLGVGLADVEDGDEIPCMRIADLNRGGTSGRAGRVTGDPSGFVAMISPIIAHQRLMIASLGSSSIAWSSLRRSTAKKV